MLKVYEHLADYISSAEAAYIPHNSDGNYTLFDFNPNDHITTEAIANNLTFDPDYLIIFDTDGDIVSRWYVLEMVRTREGQWKYILRRDVLAEKYISILDAPVFVEKGIVSDAESPLLLNNEEANVSRIKKEEILLKDETRCPWLVMYLKKGVLGNNTIGPDNDGTFTIDIPVNDEYVYETLTTPISGWSFYNYQTNDYKVESALKLCTYFDSTYVPPNPYISVFKFSFDANQGYIYGHQDPRGNISTDKSDIGDYLNTGYRYSATYLKTQTISAFSIRTTNALMAYNEKILKDSNGKYYKIRVLKKTYGVEERDITTSSAPTVRQQMRDIWVNSSQNPTEPNEKCFTLETSYENYRVEITEIKSIQSLIDFGAYLGKGTEDSMLFDAICMPYGEVSVTGGGITVNTTKDRSLKLMNGLAKALTSQYVLDLQLLPYCPFQNLITNVQTIAFSSMNYTAIVGQQSSIPVDFLIVAQESNFTFDIEQQISSPVLDNVPLSFSVKYVNDCTMLRLCSPNYNGIFEMNLAKNGGSINRFNVDVTLRPFNPYIHVNPDFSFVYGNDFNDVRGLICGGDFSLGIIDDAWNTYEIQNKNYQAIFDRQIQNLDVNNAIAKQEAIFGAAAGSISGMASGATAGLFATGNPAGGFAGAAAGLGMSALGGVLDLANLEKRQKEARSYAIDNYNLNLGNIKALPYSITKTSALTYNNKLFPFVEIYECTEVEKQAYIQKIKWNGMNLGIIGKMADFISSDNSHYFRGRLIRLETIAEDTHFLDAINEELLKGVYI